MSPLSDRHPRNDRALYVVYDFETTQNTKCTDNSFRCVPNLVCVKQICASCENEADVDVDCRRIGKIKQNFWTVTVWDLISYTFKSRPWPGRIVVIAQNAKAIDLLFLMNNLVRVKLMT